MVVLRRLDAVLEPTKKQVLDMKASLDDARVVNEEQALRQAAGQPFYNTRSSPFATCAGERAIYSGVVVRDLLKTRAADTALIAELYRRARNRDLKRVGQGGDIGASTVRLAPGGKSLAQAPRRRRDQLAERIRRLTAPARTHPLAQPAQVQHAACEDELTLLHHVGANQQHVEAELLNVVVVGAAVGVAVFVRSGRGASKSPGWSSRQTPSR